MNVITLTIEDCDHTVGNLLRSKLLQSPEVEFAGYKITHPLENKIVVELKTIENINASDFMKKASKNLKADVEKFMDYMKYQAAIHRTADNEIKLQIDLFDDKVYQLAMANSLRRIMMSEVPTFAIELVEIHKNSTCLDDELIVHRLGLIPLQTNLQQLKDFKISQTCDCNQGCPNCQITFQLDEINNHEYDNKIVTVSHLISNDKITQPIIYKFENRNVLHNVQNYSELQLSDFDKINSQIVIAVLAPKQELKFKAHATKNIGKTHSKWSPVCKVTNKPIDNCILMNIESVGNLDCIDILHYAAEILTTKILSIQV